MAIAVRGGKEVINKLIFHTDRATPPISLPRAVSQDRTP